MVKVLRSIYIEKEMLDKLFELKEKYGSVGKAIENLIKIAEEKERAVKLHEENIKSLCEKIDGMKKDIEKLNNIVIKLAKTWGVKLDNSL